VLSCSTNWLILRETFVWATVVLKVRTVVSRDLVLAVVATADEHEAIAYGEVLSGSDLADV
jgi:hypothetical protein